MLRIGLVGGEMSAADFASIAARVGDIELQSLDPRTIDHIFNGSDGPGTDGGDIDAVYLCHADDAERFCVRSARCGKHLLVEAGQLSTTGLEAVVEACDHANGCLLIANSQRFTPAVRAVKERLDAGKLGQCGLLRIHRWAPGQPHRMTHQGRLVGDIDLACWLFGEMPTHVFALCLNGVGAEEKFDYVQLHLGFPGNGMALLEDWRCRPPAEGYFSLNVIGSHGAAYADDHHNMQLLYRDGNVSARNAVQHIDTAVALVRAFVEAIAEKLDPSAAAVDARNAARVATAVTESLKCRQVINLE